MNILTFFFMFLIKCKMNNIFKFLRFSLFWIPLLFFDFKNDIYASEKRILQVCVIVDEEFISVQNWKEIINKSFNKVNSFYSGNFGLLFHINEFKTLTSNNSILSINEMFVDMKDRVECTDSEIGVIYIGQVIKGSGISATLSDRLMIVDNKLSLHEDSSIILAHELAHLFGAWHNKKKNYLMNDSGFAGFNLDPGTKAVIKFMSNRDFNKHGADLSDNTTKKFTTIFQRYKTIDVINPLSRVYIDRAIYLKEKGKISKAIKLLVKSKNLSGRWEKPRMLLAESYFINKDYENAYMEYNLARFFGAKRNEKLEKYFINSDSYQK